MDANSGLSRHSRYLVDAFAPLLRFFTDSTWASRFGRPGVCDFTIGNPHDMPLKSFVDALQSKITPRDAYWYAYKRNEPEARRIVAASLEASHRLPFEPEDIFLTNGATAALHVVLAATVDLGDEVIFLSPPWFQYETMIMNDGKALLAPGERMGYIALHPDMSHRMEFRSTIPALQMIHGWSFPNALLQHAIGDLEKISVDITHLQAKRDRLVSELLRMGYATQTPEATFYLLVRSPIPDDEEFVQLLTEYDIFCIPGSLMDLPGYFRMSITASDEMIERALPGFEIGR